ncbi:MAG: hypothetical protein JWL84_4535 [Rhodospirillales bacterium]|jgi:hypothetical protein|nr:hypothetical protein [Rhodospirillales bacterium]
MTEVRCAGCGAPMSCDPGPDCWCVQLPFQPMPEAPTACLCRACLLRSREKPDPPVTR